jgi:hypothetical protein
VGPRGPPGLESAFTDDIDRAADPARGLIGHGDLVDFDARDVGHRHVEQRLRAAVAAGAGKFGPVDLHRSVVVRKTAQRDRAGGLAAVDDADAREETHQLANILRPAVAELVERNNLPNVGGVFPLILRDGLRAHLAVLDHRERFEFNRLSSLAALGAIKHKFKLPPGYAARGHGNRRHLRRHADVGNAHAHIARRHAGQAIGTALVGHGLTAGAFEGDARIRQGGGSRSVEHPALDHTGGGLGAERGEENRGEDRDS